MNPQATRRVVSKTRYLCYLSQKATLSGTGSFLLLLGITGFSFCAFLLLSGLWWSWVTSRYDYARHPALTPLLSILFCLLISGLFVFMAWSGSRQLEKANRLEPLTPLTRQTLEQLPAEQSLVRASSEPSALQQVVLLRAATSETQTPAYELLRATTQAVPLPLTEDRRGQREKCSLT